MGAPDEGAPEAGVRGAGVRDAGVRGAEVLDAGVRGAGFGLTGTFDFGVMEISGLGLRGAGGWGRVRGSV